MTGMMSGAIVPSSWADAIDGIADEPGIAIVVGAANSGKTTWLGEATRRLSRRGRLPLAIADADIGQSTIGPPTTVALALVRNVVDGQHPVASLPTAALRFIGSTTPLGHLLPLLVGTSCLAQKAGEADAITTLVDTTGLVDGAGFQMKLRKIELLAPRHVVALQRKEELEPLLSVIRHRSGLRVHRLEVPGSTRLRGLAERASYRAQRFAEYFHDATVLELDPKQVSVLRGTGLGVRSSLAESSPLVAAHMLREPECHGVVAGLNDGDDDTLGVGVLVGSARTANGSGFAPLSGPRRPSALCNSAVRDSSVDGPMIRHLPATGLRRDNCLKVGRTMAWVAQAM